MNKKKIQPSDDQSKKSFQTLSSLFDQYQLEDKGGYITREFQDYGYRLAVALNDLKHKSLYIKMAKETDRSLLEAALSYVQDAKVESKAKLFMWRVKSLKKEMEKRDSHKK